MNLNASILLVGGYGQVGQQVINILYKKFPSLSLIIGGRSLNKAVNLANSLPNAQGIAFDIEHPQLPEGLKPDLIVALVNDPANNLLKYCIEQKIAYLDITRWTDRLKTAIALTQTYNKIDVPIVFSSSWMAGIPSALAIAMTKNFNQLDKIDIDILFAIKDNAGPNSIDYMDRLTIPFETIQNGQPVLTYAFTDKKQVQFKDKKLYSIFRFDTPDQLVLPVLTQAQNVSSRIGFDDKVSNTLLYLLVHTGIWRLFSSDRFKKLRRSVLYQPGSGDHHQVSVTLSGTDFDGHKKQQNILINDPAGQVHLTATGTSILIEEILQQQLPARVYFGETIIHDESLKTRLQEENISLNFNS